MNRKALFMLVVIAVAGVAYYAYAQGAVQVQAATPAPQAAPQVTTAAVGQVLSQTSAEKNSTAGLTPLSPDTFVSVKDHGDSQTVMVYKVDDQGKVRLTHKAKFFY